MKRPGCVQRSCPASLPADRVHSPYETLEMSLRYPRERRFSSVSVAFVRRVEGVVVAARAKGALCSASIQWRNSARTGRFGRLTLRMYPCGRFEPGVAFWYGDGGSICSLTQLKGSHGQSGQSHETQTYE